MRRHHDVVDRVERFDQVVQLEDEPDIEVVEEAGNANDALQKLGLHQPDVVLMDIQMPRLDGFETTRRIMETQPLPIIICTAATDPKEVATTFRSMEAGAVACLEKPVAPDHPEHRDQVRSLLETIKLMSEIKVVRRWPRSRSNLAVTPPRPAVFDPSRQGIRLIGIGASTGGPPMLQTILAGLPKDFPAPILIVQHIAQGFLPGLVEWLNQTTGLQVHIATHGICPLPGHVYLAPDDFHMGVNGGGHILLAHEEPENGLQPAVSYLFRSLTEACGPNVLGVLLSGMGKDGAAELKLMKDRGATTVAQDRETSVVHGMPGEAIRLDGATHVLPAEKIADTLITLVNRRSVAGEIQP